MWETINNIVVVIIGPLLYLILDKRQENRIKEERRKSEIDKEDLSEKISKKNADTQDAVKALLRDRIIDKYHGFVEAGYVDIYNREGVDRMYVEYKNLGGNSIVDKLMSDIESLPVISEEELRQRRDN